MYRRKKHLRSKAADTLFHISDRGDTDIGPIAKDDAPLVCTDILPNDSPYPKDAFMDQTRVVLDTQEDGVLNEQVKLAEPDETRVVLDTHEDGLPDELKLAEPDHNIVGETTELCQNVDTDRSMDETRVVLDTQENGSSNTQLKLAEPDHNVIVETTELCHNTDPSVSFDLNDPNFEDSMVSSSPRLPTDKDVKEGEISGDFMDFTPEDSIGIGSRVESDNNLSLLSTVAVENVGKDMTGMVNKNTRNLVDCSEIAVHGNSREPAKQATAVIGSDSSLRRSGRLRLLESNLNNSKTRNQDLVNPLKRQGPSTQEEKVYKKPKDDVSLVCTDILPNDSPCPKDAMDETGVVLDTQEDGLLDEQLKLAEPDDNIVGESTVLCHNVDTDRSMDETRVVLDTQVDGSSNTQLKLAEPDDNIVGESTVLCHNVDTHRSMDETRVVLDTQVDGSSNTQLKLAEPDDNIVGESTVLCHNVDTDRSMDETRVVLDTQEDSLSDTQLKLAEPDHNIVRETTVLCHNVDTDRSMDETRVVLETQENGSSNTQLKLAEPDHNITVETTELCHNTDPSVSFDLNDQDNLMDSMVSSSPRLPTDKDVNEGEISGDIMDFTDKDSIGIESLVESDNNLSLLSTVAAENVGKDMTGIVNTNTRNLVDYSEIVGHGNSREPAKQATAVIGSDSSLRRSGRVMSLKSSKTRNQDLVNPLKRHGSSTQEENVYKKTKKLVDLNINLAGEHHEGASCKVVDASVNKSMDNPEDKEAPSVRKIDKAWEHVTQHIEENGKKVLICNFCRKTIRGGGINRVKKHLAGRKGEVTPCTLVDPDVKFAIQCTFKGTDHKSKEEVLEDDDDEKQDDVNLLNNKDKGDTDIGHITKDDVSLVCTDILPNDSPCPMDVSMDETRVVLDTQEDGLLDEQLKLAEPDETRVVLDKGDTDITKDASMDETLVVLDKGDTDITKDASMDETLVVLDTQEDCLLDSIGIESTIVAENVGKDMTGIVNKNTKNLVDYSEIAVPGNSREPAKQATAVIGSHLSLRRSGRVLSLKGNLKSSKTRNQDLVNPLKDAATEKKKKRVVTQESKAKKQSMDNPKEKEAPSARKLDNAWEHVTQHVEENGKKVLICKFCRKTIRGGGINRVKQHLAGRKGEVVPCTLVDLDVRFAIQGTFKDTDHKSKQKGLPKKKLYAKKKEKGLAVNELRAIIAEEVARAIQAAMPAILESAN